MMKRLVWACGVMLLLAGCVAHEKVGDKAAAVGDWRTALQSYGTALAEEPDSPELQEKFRRAKQEAVAAAYKNAQACAAASDWSCAVGEADYALQVDSGNAEIATFRANAARSLALARIARTHDEALKGNFKFALDTIEGARELSKDPSVEQAAAQAKQGLAALAETEGERLRKSKAYNEALEALGVAAAINPAKRGKLEALQREHQQFLEAEYERFAKEGDAALARRDWAAADASYQEALRQRPGGRAEALSRYAGGIALGEASVARRDFASATKGYSQAVQSGHDRDGYAAQRLQLVEVRPYTVRIRSVLARPLRPNGTPWVGRYHPLMGQLVALFSGDLLGQTGRSGRRVIELAMRLPPENRPTLSVQALLPDGMVLTTPPVTGLYVTYDSEFVVTTNALDLRKLRLRVVHGTGPNLEEVGVVEFPLGEAVQRPDAALGNQSVARLQLTFEPAQGRADGMFANMFPLNDGSNQARDYSVPTPTAVGYQLRGVRAAVTSQALMVEPDEGPGELVVELVQRGRVVYRSTQLDNLYEAQWSANMNLFVERGEQLRLLVWDMDPQGQHDLLVDMPVSADQLARGTVEVSSANGSKAALRVEPRQVWAGDVTP